MKTIQRKLIISLVPLLIPLSAFGEPENQNQPDHPIQGAKNNAASWRASHITGVDVKNASDKTIGEVEDLLLNMKSGKLLAVVVSSGEFIGVADTLSVVPPNSLRYDKSIDAFVTSLTKEQLEKAPQFTTAEWTNYNENDFIEALRSFSDMIGGDTTTADKTIQTKKEIHNGDESSSDQGNSSKDIQITRGIRSKLMDTDMSSNAKNIKITTRNELVILKGVVDSKAEQQAVLKIVRNHTNTTNITNNLKVKVK